MKKKLKKAGLIVFSIVLLIAGGIIIWLGFNQPPPPIPEVDSPIVAAESQKPIGPSSITKMEEEITPENMSNNTLLIPAIDTYAYVNTENGYGTTPNGYISLPPAKDVTRWVDGANVMSDEGSHLITGHLIWYSDLGSLYHLANIKAGHMAYVKDNDGNREDYQLVSLKSYHKVNLPREVWKKDGNKKLVVITCGGNTWQNNQGLWEYTDNIVAEFKPINRIEKKD